MRIIIPTYLSLFSLLLFFSTHFSYTTCAVTVTLNVNVINPRIPSMKENYTDSFRLMYIGLYSNTDVKVQAMRFAVQYINNMPDLLPNTRLDLYGANAQSDRGITTSAVLAGYAGYNVQGIIGAESEADTVAIQYIAGAYWMPQINPSVVEQTLSNRDSFRSLFSIIPDSSDQQIAVLAVLKSLGIKKVLLITTNNDYGNEFKDMTYNVEAVALNISFYQVTIDSTTTDLDQKLTVIRDLLPFYRYVVMHCTSNTGLTFLQSLGDAGLIGPSYLYIITHQMSIAVQERAANAIYLPYFNGVIGVSARFRSETPFATSVRSAFFASSYANIARNGLRSAWFAFDAVYAYALALNNMLNRGVPRDEITGENYFDELLNLNFEGATGNITVNTSAARRHGLWDIVNFVAVNVSSTSNGTVVPFYCAIANGQSTDFLSKTRDFIFYGGRTTVPDPYVAPPDPLKIRTFDKNLSAALGAIVGLAILVAVFAAVMLFFYWNAFVKHGSFYCAVIIAGVFISYVSALVILPEPTDALCVAFPWFLGIGFTFVYGCLFIKTCTLYRVWLDAEQFKKTQLSPFTIVKLIGVAVILESIFLIIWTAVDPPRAKLHEMVNGYYMLQCRTENITFWAIFVSIKGVWLIFGAVLSILTRRIMREFNHSSSISYAIYNIFALLVIGVPLAITLEDIPGGRLIIQVAVIVIAFTFTTVSLFFNVWYRVFVPIEMDHITPNKHYNSSSTSGGLRRENSSYSQNTYSQNSSQRMESYHTSSASGSGSHDHTIHEHHPTIELHSTNDGSTKDKDSIIAV